ncbi:MAG TPA: BON domain-containing protein [Candidatus Binataceae bacterium]|nr:BON domain-containing protein [Candidatus Binataceae bacterium]
MFKRELVLTASGIFAAFLWISAAHAQSASSSFHKAGEETESAGSSAGHAIANAFHGTVTASEDTAITAKVKTRLHDNDVTKGKDIHVTTVAGVVTLRGTVSSEAISSEAAKITESTGGVKEVKNRLKVRS